VPRFFFHLRLEHESTDGEGVELPDFQSAWSEAVRAFGEMLRTGDSSLSPHSPFEMTIADDAGNPVCRLRFSTEMLQQLD